MVSVALRIDERALERAAVTVPTEWRGALNALRVVALGCRVSARTDIFRACALLKHTRCAASEAYAEALLRCLHHAIGARAVFLRPGENEVSFDEAWLIQAVIASHERDDDSFVFLIRSRISKTYQRQIAFLIKGISDRSHLT